jgi:phosphate:Na+ symporter
MSFHAFVKGDVDSSYKVEPLKEMIEILCNELKTRHIQRVQKGECGLELGFVFNDLLMNYERIAGHCSNLAVALIELNVSVFDTHEYVNSLREIKDDRYRNYLNQYQEKYSL